MNPEKLREGEEEQEAVQNQEPVQDAREVISQWSDEQLLENFSKVKEEIKLLGKELDQAISELKSKGAKDNKQITFIQKTYDQNRDLYRTESTIIAELLKRGIHSRPSKEEK